MTEEITESQNVNQQLNIQCEVMRVAKIRYNDYLPKEKEPMIGGLLRIRACVLIEVKLGTLVRTKRKLAQQV